MSLSPSYGYFYILVSASFLFIASCLTQRTEFALSQQTISKRITDPSEGCLKRLLELSNQEKIVVHNHISKDEIKFGAKIGTGNAGEVYKGHLLPSPLFPFV